MNNCLWCGTDYEWSDRCGSALCPDCAVDSAEDARVEAAAWAAVMDAEDGMV